MSPYLKQVLANRAKQGALAAVGTFAISLLSTHQVCSSRGLDPETSSTMRFCLFLSLLAGTAWASHPDSGGVVTEDDRKEVKRTTRPAILLHIRRYVHV